VHHIEYDKSPIVEREDPLPQPRGKSGRCGLDKSGWPGPPPMQRSRS